MPRESLAIAFSGQLTYSPESERAWDKLTALCMGCVTAENLTDTERSFATDLARKGHQVELSRRSSREAHLAGLGVSLCALKVSNAPRYHGDAVERLSEALGWKAKGVDEEKRERIAHLAISEWILEACFTCMGKREIADMEGLVKPCHACGSSGKHRYSDAERTAQLGEDAKQHEAIFSIAHAQIALAVSIAEQSAARILRGAQTCDGR